MSFCVFRSARRHDFKNYAWPGRLSGVPTYRADPCRPIENVPTLGEWGRVPMCRPNYLESCQKTLSTPKTAYRSPPF